MAYFCSNCKETITPDEYEYSIKKYGSALCRGHQKSASTESEKNGSAGSGSNGLSHRKRTYHENMIKGRLAETLIEQLFLALDYSVFRYGMENTVPGVMDLLKGVRSDVAQNIRGMPDFVVQDEAGNVFFIEVKFRASEEFRFSDLSKDYPDYPYHNCYFILVSKKHIKCITYYELKDGQEITPKSQNYLGNRKEFDLDKEVIIDFCNFAVKFFDNV